jgi:hypothetical protein
MRNYRRFQRLGFVAAGLALLAVAAGAPVARAAAPSGLQLAATLDGKTSYAAAITYQDSLFQTRWSETWIQVGQGFSLKAAQDGKAYSYLGSADKVCNIGSGAKAICTDLEVNTGMAGWTDTYFLSYYGQRPAEVFRNLPVNLRLSLVHTTAGCTASACKNAAAYSFRAADSTSQYSGTIWVDAKANRPVELLETKIMSLGGMKDTSRTQVVITDWNDSSLKLPAMPKG